MQLGDILTAHGLATAQDIERALLRQKEVGGRLGDNLVALGIISAEQLDQILNGAPAAPKTIEETGIDDAGLLTLLLKAAYGGRLETASALSDELKLPPGIVNELIETAVDRKLMENLGIAAGMPLSESRYALTDTGRRRAVEALNHNQYVGPAPVSLAAYHDRIYRQRITNERIDREQIVEAFSDLVIPPEFIRRLGPAINSGRCILLYGPPGNGKTSIAEKIGNIFNDIIYIPYCVEVEGQIIKIFDASVHHAVNNKPSSSVSIRSIRRDEGFDRRWVACRRPIIVTGGELTLEMLDLKFNAFSKFYEAPLHMKALGGTFIIDDFGRQIVTPEELLNRWIVPLQSRIDFLKLHTGKSFSIPFDELVIFSTNMAPADLMDPAFLRRIPYKLETEAPTAGDFRKIFRNVAAQRAIELPEEIIDYVLEELQEVSRVALACYQPGFIVDQVAAACKYEGMPAHFRQELVADALKNLYVKIATDPNLQTGAEQPLGLNGHARVAAA